MREHNETGLCVCVCCVCVWWGSLKRGDSQLRVSVLNSSHKIGKEKRMLQFVTGINGVWTQLRFDEIVGLGAKRIASLRGGLSLELELGFACRDCNLDWLKLCATETTRLEVQEIEVPEANVVGHQFALSAAGRILAESFTAHSAIKRD